MATWNNIKTDQQGQFHPVFLAHFRDGKRDAREKQSGELCCVLCIVFEIQKPYFGAYFSHLFKALVFQMFICSEIEEMYKQATLSMGAEGLLKNSSQERTIICLLKFSV